jgi:galactoside 2-L-fucosyltransferase 1/2
MKWFRENVPGKLLFLIVSDDLEWCREHLLDREDVVIASKNPAHDLALLSLSNHSIIDYGTFGEWGALMAGGHTISLNVDKYFNAVMAAKDKNWHVFEV